MMLFDDTERYDASPSAYSEDTFSFYNRVAGPTWTRIRRTLDGWFADYPVEHSADLRGRFRSNREGAHASAFWEMYLHHLFGRLGYEVTVHPTVPDTTRQPDFEITRGDERLYVEAAVVFSGIVDEEADPVRDGSWTRSTRPPVRTSWLASRSSSEANSDPGTETSSSRWRSGSVSSTPTRS
jgi:hypothetical protein